MGAPAGLVYGAYSGWGVPEIPNITNSTSTGPVVQLNYLQTIETSNSNLGCPTLMGLVTGWHSKLQRRQSRPVNPSVGAGGGGVAVVKSVASHFHEEPNSLALYELWCCSGVKKEGDEVCKMIICQRNQIKNQVAKYEESRGVAASGANPKPLLPVLEFNFLKNYYRYYYYESTTTGAGPNISVAQTGSASSANLGSLSQDDDAVDEYNSDDDKRAGKANRLSDAFKRRTNKIKHQYATLTKNFDDSIERDVEVGTERRSVEASRPGTNTPGREDTMKRAAIDLKTREALWKKSRKAVRKSFTELLIDPKLGTVNVNSERFVMVSVESEVEFLKLIRRQSKGSNGAQTRPGASPTSNSSTAIGIKEGVRWLNELGKKIGWNDSMFYSEIVDSNLSPSLDVGMRERIMVWSHVMGQLGWGKVALDWQRWDSVWEGLCGDQGSASGGFHFNIAQSAECVTWDQYKKRKEKKTKKPPTVAKTSLAYSTSGTNPTLRKSGNSATGMGVTKDVRVVMSAGSGANANNERPQDVVLENNVPVCMIAAGYASGYLNACMRLEAIELAKKGAKVVQPESEKKWEVVEIMCEANGDPECVFVVSTVDRLYDNVRSFLKEKLSDGANSAMIEERLEKILLLHIHATQKSRSSTTSASATSMNYSKTMRRRDTRV
eukprot:TRINITY_DN4505_c0_g1_i1.p1 TRINITY_DN4505_c0_g1~~TRINITY_DN4505_c0_g1_i1.p1  ORF type:complete len:664 (-),score=160.16 TRINITY_DN4505_c0_g1_i1:71-2062(-)